MPIETGSQLLKDVYNLQDSAEVNTAAKRTRHQVSEVIDPETGEVLPEESADIDRYVKTALADPKGRIENYLDRLDSIINPPELKGHPNFDRRERNLKMLKNALHRQFVIKPEAIPESYWENQRQMAREQGHGDIEITNEMRAHGAEIIIADQKSSLDKWVDYLADNDAYPLWLKYFAIRGVLGMGTYDKEKYQFNKRGPGTAAPFPDLNPEALAYVLDAVEKRQGPEYAELSDQIRQARNELKRLKGEYRLAQQKQESNTEAIVAQINEVQDRLDSMSKAQAQLVSQSLNVPDETRAELASLLQTSDFAKLYAWAIEKVAPAEENELLITEGKWVKFSQDTNPTSYVPEGFDRALVPSLQGHGTGWCIAGESVAKNYLELGDFYIYYSLDKSGQATIPRVAIRMEGNHIAEVRGIAPDQNLDPYIAPIVRQKLTEFPDGKLYEKKAHNMQMLTYIEHKTKTNQSLTKDELTFLYEINEKIQGFGQDRDPRIAEIRSQRDLKVDASIIFDCQPDQIALSQDKITPDTKVYIGPLYTGRAEQDKSVFQRLSHIEHIYTSFPPEGKIRLSRLEIGGKTKEQLIQELKTAGIILDFYASDALRSLDFTTQTEAETIDLVRLSVADLGFPNGATTGQICNRAVELGLELCPAEVAPYQRLQDLNQPLGERYHIVTKSITNWYDTLNVFDLERFGGKLWLHYYREFPTQPWAPEGEFIFRLRPDSHES